MSNELKPCPFCGCTSMGAEISNEDKAFRIYCCECPAGMELYFADAGIDDGSVIGFDEMRKIMDELIGLWNRRADNG